MATTHQETFFRCKSYQEAQKQSLGYEEDSLVDNLVANINENPPWRIENNDFYIEHRQLELLNALMRIICENKFNSLKVADVGGGNGYLSITAKENLPMIAWDWTVFESDKVAISYVQFEKDSGIKWQKSSSNIADNYDIGLFSCTLQYLESPFHVLRKFSSKCKYLILMRIPFIGENNHIITKQIFTEGVYQEVNASWPAWFFSKNKFYSEIEQIGEVIYKWKTPTEILYFEGKDVMLEGVLVRVNQSMLGKD
jgi:putative methyltransferase (TIGR04325 family)